ncbi:DeoR family transcriptional regulator [Caldicellulosiruptor danielii]|uniref:DeoR family transcriptional regulator n=1 Tax=Anaerocellum danielii TaxID=1387557 RepID=A0ABZ0TYD9_9FIRM|nr:DeoR family transcriptional regulator [Caldicellulosiruptor danielii]WPX08484.1 DeoR family transcriptional regulator [Caldicellulosiruptor danielii]
MLVAERLKKIKEILLQKKHIDVATLAELLNVSEVTIRRDLDKLESEGFLIKTYGRCNFERRGNKASITNYRRKFRKRSNCKGLFIHD